MSQETGNLFNIAPKNGRLLGEEMNAAIEVIRKKHYAHLWPSGKTYLFRVAESLVAFSIPANPNIAKFLFKFEKPVVWELSRLWAPDGHERDLLTRSISQGVRWLHQLEPSLDAVVSYADPNAGHRGGVYRAASWIYTGQSDESRCYVDASGQIVARRKFHSGGGAGLKKAEIESMGYSELKRPGKHRFVKPVSRRARKAIAW